MGATERKKKEKKKEGMRERERERERQTETETQRDMISTTLKPSSLDCASIPGYLSAAVGSGGNPIPPQSKI